MGGRMPKIDRDALELVVEDLEKGNPLTFQHVGSVFGPDFWMLLVEALMDSADAARAIQNAINRLRGAKIEEDDIEWEDEDE
jgi:hypothetical protein